MATIETDRPRSESLRTPARNQDETKLTRDETKLTRDETKLSFKTTEFYAMAGVIVAILAAAAYSDSLGDVRAWTLVAGIAAAYIISRGLAKAGSSYTGEQGPRSS
jgi:uncharacterized protein YijF (DUF1287 family)